MITYRQTTTWSDTRLFLDQVETGSLFLSLSCLQERGVKNELLSLSLSLSRSCLHSDKERCATPSRAQERTEFAVSS